MHDINLQFERMNPKKQTVPYEQEFGNSGEEEHSFNIRRPLTWVVLLGTTICYEEKKGQYSNDNGMLEADYSYWSSC